MGICWKIPICKYQKEKDLGMIINNKMTPSDHINEKTRAMNILLANMSMAFTPINEDVVRKIIIPHIRPTLEYAAAV